MTQAASLLELQTSTSRSCAPRSVSTSFPRSARSSTFAPEAARRHGSARQGRPAGRASSQPTSRPTRTRSRRSPRRSTPSRPRSWRPPTIARSSRSRVRWTGCKRRRDKIEMESLQLMERIDKATAQTAKIDDALAQLAEKEAALVEQFKSVGGALQTAHRRHGDAARGTAAKSLAADLARALRADPREQGRRGRGRPRRRGVHRVPHVAAGRARPRACSRARRSARLPAVPPADRGARGRRE